MASPLRKDFYPDPLGFPILEALGVPDLPVTKIVMVIDVGEIPIVYLKTIVLPGESVDKLAKVITRCVKDVEVSDTCDVVVTEHPNEGQ